MATICYSSAEHVFGKPLPTWKRAFDLVASGLGLLALSPVFLVVAVLIKCVSPGPVLFRQERVGFQGRRFMLYKFRTMRPNADTGVHQTHLAQLIRESAKSNGDGKPMEKLEADPRIIPFGTLLRKSCIDELPQLINVFRGDMSLVGPRPAIPYEAREYLFWHTGRFDTVPGMTGLWQVSGKNKLTFKEMVRLDITYARNLSILLDAQILVRTIPTVFGQVFERRARRAAQATAERA